MSDLWRRSASELAALIARKEVSSREVIEAHLARIAAVNPNLNAVVKVLAEEARKGADEADRKVAVRDTLGPLHGVPFTIKENIDLAGAATTWGLPAFARAVVHLDAPVVERMREAGAVPIGRTNLPDMGLRVHTRSSLHGVTRNPWNAGRTASGSSGGEAVALATGMSPVGLGNDLGGSLRNPASALRHRIDPAFPRPRA
jgi:amidase